MKELKEQDDIVDLKSYEDFGPEVLQSSTPVILDCYADWCNPCQQLTPLLEKGVLDNLGKLRLVKVNIDLLPRISDQLNVRSIPAVFLIHGGNVIDTFTGVPSEE